MGDLFQTWIPVVALVGQDLQDRGLLPVQGVVVLVAILIMSGWAGDALLVEDGADALEAVSVQAQCEDASNDRRGDRVDLEPVQAGPEAALVRMWVWAGVGEKVAVGRPAAHIPALDPSQSAHRDPHPAAGAGDFGFGQDAEHRHGHRMRSPAGSSRS